MSRVVVMDLRRHNTVLVGHHRYFIFHTDGRHLLVRDWCPHRGGPLSLSRLTVDRRRLVCPWHGTKVGTAAVKRTSVPMVRTGDEAVVMLTDAEADAPVTVIQKRILANLPPEAESTEPLPGHCR
jgi:Rieske 2Fe-2S protein